MKSQNSLEIVSAGTQPEGCGVAAELSTTPRSGEGFLYVGAENPYTPVRKWVSGLGEVTILSEQAFAGRRQKDVMREDRFMRVELDGFGYGVHETLPDPIEDIGISLIYKPGFSELIEVGSAKAMHDGLAAHLPGVRVMSVASEGIGPTGERFGFKEAKDHGVQEMGENLAKLAYALCGNEPVLMAGCSMGTVVGQHALAFDALHGHNLNAYPVRYASAIVEKFWTMYYMGTLFPASMVLDTPREVVRLVKKGDKAELEELSQMIKGRNEDMPALAAQMLSLMGGVAIGSVVRVARAYHGGINISGALDPLNRKRMWSSVKQKDNMTHIDIVRGRGHAMAADGEGGSQKIANDLQRWHILENLVA